MIESQAGIEISAPAHPIRTFSSEELLQKRKRLRRELLAGGGLQEIRIAVLGGVTTNEVVDLLELVLLSDGFQPVFYQSEYNKYYEDAVLDSEKLQDFRPDLVYIHTHFLNILQFPPVGTSEADYNAALEAEIARFRSIWAALQQTMGCQVIQNNFELPPFPVLGNLDSTVAGGKRRFINELNLAFAMEASANRRLIIHDINALAAQVGLARWFDWSRWYSYKILTTPVASFEIAKSLAALVGSMRGKAKKCLVLDLDNTLWGGVIGDDGLDKIQIGTETAVSEAYTAFQSFCLEMQRRGVLLAVCSKNNEDIARSGFSHPDSVLKLEHFSAFYANWEPKHDNIQKIARELNLGLESFVFIDDNPAERAIVAAQLPMVAVPDVGSEVALFPGIIHAEHYFESVLLSKEDLERAETYAANAARAKSAPAFGNYGEYLDSLEMTAEIRSFTPVYLDRITQLINKTNQFNLTTRRYTFAEIEKISQDPNYITLYGRLTDRFGDNGLISVVIGRRNGADLTLDLWLMSCRVLKRGMEDAMLDALDAQAKAMGVKSLVGVYKPTAKNAMVENLYGELGFTLERREGERAETVWRREVASYAPRNFHIAVNGKAKGEQ